jgi:hypothetical protein
VLGGHGQRNFIEEFRIELGPDWLKSLALGKFGTRVFLPESIEN